jgi:hypothetical protein
MKNFFYFLCLLTFSSVFASESMRNCMLLPITDGADNKVGFQVFEDLENYIKESSWCTYRSNSELINVLGQYSKNLENHLGNKDVLKVIADKTKAGTMIKVSLELSPGFTEVKLEVIGENGEDKFFKENTQLKSNDVSLISQTIKNWLDVYEKTIPYQGRVKGVLGDQFTIDIGKKSNIYNGAEIIIERITGKRQHPLLKEIVDYQSEKIAEAKVFDVSDNQAQAKVIQYEGNKKLRLEDWVKVRSSEQRKAIEQLNYGNEKEENGKLGTAGIFLNFGAGSASQSGSTDRSKKGLLYGANLESELWLTRAYWVGIDISKSLGNYSTDTGSFITNSYTANNSIFRFKFGYKYLPMGFFYGPQLDVYAGYASFDYGFNTNTNDGYTDFTFSGMLVGMKGNIPIYEKIRMYLVLDFLVTSSYKEQNAVFGSDESSSHYRIGAGGTYNYEQNIMISAGLEALSNKASFTGATKEEQFKDISAKVGTIFTF